MASTSFLELLREARAGQGRGNEELLRAVLPLLEQLHQVHEAGLVAPLDGVDAIFCDGGALWFHRADATAPTQQPERLREVQRGPAGGGIDVVEQGSLQIDVDRGQRSYSVDLYRGEGAISRPVFVPGYTSWEHELGHHDALTDIFCAGMLLASLALGADFTEPSELADFQASRHRLTRVNERLHPVIARAIVRMTEPDRHARVQDLPALIQRLRSYRDVDERADAAVDFESIEGFLTADRTCRRRMVQSVLQSRLFDVSKRNRLIYYRSTQQMLDLTMASVPTQLAVETVRPGDLFLWDGPAGQQIASGRAIRLDRYLRFEEAPWIKGTLDKIRSEDRRSRTEVGFSQLRLVVAFLNWHNLKESEHERIRSPLLLLPVSVSIKRGVRNSYVMQAQTELAEVNPVLRHFLHEVYGLQLPDQVDLGQSDVATFHQALTTAIQRSEPGISLHLITRPQIRILRETARRRTDTWRRRSRATGRGLRTELGVDYSYARTNFQPLGLQLFRQKVMPERFELEAHLTTARPVAPPQRSEPEQPDPDPDVAATTRQVYQEAEAAAGPYDWAIDLTHCTLGNFNYRKMTLVRDYDRMIASETDEHPAFDTLFSLDARQIAEPPEQGSGLDLFGVVPADPSQAAAIHWARSGRSLIIQGPPGTGKSQTITNLIADFAARGKRVLFVCQKRAALDVVYHRLAQHDLDRLSVLIHDAQADKKGFIEDLKQTYTAWTAGTRGPSAEARRGEVLEQLDEPLGALQRFAQAMTSPVDGGSRALIEVIGDRLGQLELPGLDAEHAELLPDHRAWSTHSAAVHDAVRALVDVGEQPLFSELALRHLGRGVLDAPQPVAALRRALAELSELLSAVREAADRVKPEASSAELVEALALAEALRPLLPDQLGLLDRDSGRSMQLEQVAAQRARAARELARAEARTEPWSQKLSPPETTTALVRAQQLAALLAPIRWLTPAWWRLRRILAERYDFERHTVQPSHAEVLAALAQEHELREQVEALDEESRERFGFEGSLAEFVALVGRLRDPGGRSKLQRELVRSWSRDHGAAQDVLGARQAIDALRQLAAEVFDGGQAIGFGELEERVVEASRAIDLLPEVLGPLRQLQEASPQIREAVRTLPLTPSQWDAAVDQHALDQTFRRDRLLARFGDQALRRRQIELSHGHHELLGLNAQVIRERVRRRFQERVAICGLAARELSTEERALKKRYSAGRRVLEREFEKVMRHRSIRELSEGDTGAVVYDLKPIWLMSPLSISDTIPMEAQRFDVVIFDEASQIPLEEAVPAIYRAPQMIVVGDEMQLPPTNFFSSGRTPDEGDPSAEIHYDLDADSFLSHAARCLPATMLRWHYRSRHEALIRFSNQAFYAGRLLTVPDRLRAVERDPIEVSDPEAGDANAACVLDRPISFHRLQRSPYTSRTNAGEARYIARLVRGILRSGSQLTLGIVAFSEAQQGAIEAALSALAASDPVFRRELDEAQEREDDGQLVGLFVKNLENVQGDERDIILLSVCYGPDASGKMRMNFGPINKGGGEKRLNVVFSRARRHMAVVSSIDHAAITNQYNDGALCLRRYLRYAEAASVGDGPTMDAVARALGRDQGTPEPPRVCSPVADALADALGEEGLVVARGVGSSGFWVDLAVGRDDEDSFRVAVLIDRLETYASCEPFEAHHVRPSVLRAFGWAVVDVLHKDWLSDPAGCLARVLRALEDPEAFAPPPPPSTAPGPDSAVPGGSSAPLTAGDEALVVQGATIVLTGALPGTSRAEVERRIRAAGGRLASAITRRTSYVVVGQRPGGMLQEARQRGVRLVGAEAFVAALEIAGAEAIDT